MTDEEKDRRITELEWVAFGVYHGLARILSDGNFTANIGKADTEYLGDLIGDLKTVLGLKLLEGPQ